MNMHIMVMGPGGHVMHMGGPPPSDKSPVGHEFNEHMREVCAEFPYSTMNPVSSEVDVWNGRRLRVKPSASGAWCEGQVVSLAQYNTGPFSSGTRWKIRIKLDNARAAKDLGIRSGKEKSFELCRCNVNGGGTISENAGLASQVLGLRSFEWLGDEPIAAREPLQGEAAPPRVGTVTTAGECCCIGEELERRERYAEAVPYYERASRLCKAARPYSAMEHATALGNLALVHKRLAHFEKALKLNEESIKVDPHPTVFENIATLMESIEAWNGTAGTHTKLIDRAGKFLTAREEEALEQEAREQAAEQAAARKAEKEAQKKTTGAAKAGKGAQKKAAPPKKEIEKKKKGGAKKPAAAAKPATRAAKKK